MGEQLSRIRKLDPTVKGWEDVFSMPQYGEFSRLVQRGCTPVQAYQLACFERIMAQRVAAARRAAALAARGKAHLSPIPAAAGDCFAVPPESMRSTAPFSPSGARPRSGPTTAGAAEPAGDAGRALPQDGAQP